MNFLMKVWKNNSSGQKLVSIPKQKKIKAGDYVMISSVPMPKPDPRLFKIKKGVKK